MPSGEIDSAFMVKSRRSASTFQSRPNATIGLAAEGLDVLAQSRHLERHAVDHQRDGAVIDAGRHRLEPGGGGAADHLVGHRRGGDIDVAERQPHQRVARGAADHARLLAVAIEEAERAPHRRVAQPGFVVETLGRGRRHRSVPGTRRPFSMWAGT